VGRPKVGREGGSDARVRRFSGAQELSGSGGRLRRARPLRGRVELLAGLIAAGLAAVAISPGTAGAATRGFHVFNLISFPLMLNGTGIISGDFSGGHPAPNSVLQPGVGYDDWAKTYVFGLTTNSELTYSVRNDGVGIGTFNPFLQIYSINTNQVRPHRILDRDGLAGCVDVLGEGVRREPLMRIVRGDGHVDDLGLPRGKSRTLRLSVKVADAQRSFCVAVNATASHALGARAQACAAEAAASPPTGGLG
jgi:hypothetical protein